jgi:hypothetical protein
MVHRKLTAIAAFCLVVLVGCSGLRARTPSPAATATAPPSSQTPVATPVSLFPPAVGATLRRYTLTQADMPDGYTAGGVLEVPNEQAANDYADPNQATQEITETGRQGGLGQQLFGPGSVVGSLGLSIELFKDAAGARRWAAQPPPSPAALQMTPVEADRSFGDASSVMHWSQGAQSGYVLSFSEGSVVYGLGLQAPSGQESLAPLETLAQSIDKKAKQLSN